MGVTFAMAIKDESTEKLRVRFTGRLSVRIDAVYCEDLYSEQMKSEKDSEPGQDYFT